MGERWEMIKAEDTKPLVFKNEITGLSLEKGGDVCLVCFSGKGDCDLYGRRTEYKYFFGACKDCIKKLYRLMKTESVYCYKCDDEDCECEDYG